jgi:hypothetical protein
LKTPQLGKTLLNFIEQEDTSCRHVWLVPWYPVIQLVLSPANKWYSLLPWAIRSCRELFALAVTVVGHRRFCFIIFFNFQLSTFNFQSTGLT